MAKASSFLLIGYLILAALAMSSSTVTVVDATGKQGLSWVPTKVRCQGSMAECLAEDEFNMDNEINRRILATTQYISYAALQRDSVSCSRRGASYYNCKSGAEANPYNRGCSAITQCRS